jgi:hypothetical protein
MGYLISSTRGSRLEYALFSCRPELLVIEVKKPEHKPQSNRQELKETGVVFNGELVAGPVYDYLKGMVNMGNALPFGKSPLLTPGSLNGFPPKT